jgi:DNA-binding CsgD family transcriptional regulator
MADIDSLRRLLGRGSECDTLERLLARVRAGGSQVLVLRGEAGVGKTALTEHLVECASDCRVARAAGVESEMELPFAGLHQLCAPLLARLETLPAPQRDALRIAFGLSAGPAPDRFLVGVAVLGLLSDAAEERPLVCVIDDAQWQDRASAQALAFVARRLAADSVGLVFAVREPSDGRELEGLPELNIGGLADAEARVLLESVTAGPLDDRVRDRIVAETRGNPLALLELPRGLSPAQLAGGFGVPDVMPLASRIEQSFVRRVESLPLDTRRLLVLAAAEPIGDVMLLWRAAERIELGPDAAAPAQTAGLIELGARVRFRHPLVRSAAYRSADVPERQQAHRALADATNADIDPDRRAWHRAQAAAGPDEALADELIQAAARARARGGVAAAAAFFGRAAELTADPVRRGARALDAAQAKFDAAAPEVALELLASAEIAPLDELQRARLERLRAQVTFARTRGSDAAPLLLDAAKRLEPLDAGLARETYLEVLRAEIFAGRLSGGRGVRDAAEMARAAPPRPGPPRAIDLLLDGLVTRFTDGYAAGVDPLRRALDAFSREDGPSEDDMRWLWLACPVAPEPVAPDLWDAETWNALAARAVTLARGSGALSALPIALTYRAVVDLHAGEFDAAEALIAESDAIALATGSTPLAYTSLALAAWRGHDEAQALATIDSDVKAATARGEGRAVGMAEYARAVVYNGFGHYENALAAAQRACDHDDLGLYAWGLTELVEAAARSGRHDVAAAAVEQLAERTRAAGTDWALGIEARSRALAGDGHDAEALYREAIERLARSRIVIHLARAHLVYGEWLRREHRRLDAREQLRTAHDMLATIGAEAFAERGRRELLATGETVRKRTVQTLEALTPQEAQVARMARDGQTNPEIAAQLFISARTVEYHLRKVFTKLDIRSRKELGRALPDLTSV